MEYPVHAFAAARRPGKGPGSVIGPQKSKIAKRTSVSLFKYRHLAPKDVSQSGVPSAKGIRNQPPAFQAAGFNCSPAPPFLSIAYSMV